MSEQIERFGKYMLLEKLATGGMAEVYLAKSPGAGGIAKFVALKRILPQFSSNPEYIEMFKEEAKIAVNLNHSNVVSIFDFGIVKGQFFLVMEYVEGRNLRQILNHMKKSSSVFSIDQVTYLIKEIAAGLDHAHRCLDSTTGRPLNITHRDMSPQNVMVSFSGEVKVVDFGIAKAESQMENTRAGTLKGKFGYMSPEQAEGLAVDLRTDIFSLGIVMWELLANDRLFVSNNEINTLRKIRECHIPSLRKINPRIPAELERICNKALAKDRNLRYQTSNALYKDLNKFLNTHYPEFSPHEFSAFIRELYSDVIIENRNKIVEYSKIQVPDMKEQTEITATLTQTNSEAAANAKNEFPEFDPPSFDEDQPVSPNGAANQTLNFSDLKNKTQQNRRRRRKSGEDTITKSVGTTTPSYRSKTQKTKTQKTSTGASLNVGKLLSTIKSYITTALLMGIVVLGAYLFLQTKLKNQNNSAQQNTGGGTKVSQEPTSGSLDFAQTGVRILHINSQPDGAQIFVNGQDSGFQTPGRVTIEANISSTITLRKDGYLPYQTSTKRFKEDSLNATLQKARMGYIDLNVSNGGSNPTIMINGIRLTEKLPITKYAVPADTPITVRVENPYTRMAAEQTGVVGADQKKQFNLILQHNSQRQPSSPGR